MLWGPTGCPAQTDRKMGLLTAEVAEVLGLLRAEVRGALVGRGVIRCRHGARGRRAADLFAANLNARSGGLAAGKKVAGHAAQHGQLAPRPAPRLGLDLSAGPPRPRHIHWEERVNEQVL